MQPIEVVILRDIEAAIKAKGYDAKQPQGLFAPLDYILSLGGKRIRPLLCCLAARAISGDYTTAIPIALGLEIFHNFTLLHDDLMDRSPLRRGQATVHSRWGDNTAILSGDVMCIEAYKAFEDIDSPSLLKEILPIFNTMAVEICRGQQYDMEFETRSNVTVAEYLEMIRLKTAVLLGASLRLGALASGAKPSTASELDRVGQSLGLAFQIQDDYLDVYGDKKTFGKPIGGDIINAKKTLLLIYTQSTLIEQDRTELERLMSLPINQSDERIEGVRQLYNKCGAGTYAKEEVHRLTQEALQTLTNLKLNEERIAPLIALFEGLSARMN
ncbi:MAG: polyprenyl synthetase family protein [Porphyromonadaceae bacterium]|nr:polyprenyl synthetase family protein [Porphyromonadaceae bacterium]